MSTKIYNGYALPLLDLATLNAWAMQLRTEIQAAAALKQKKRQIQLATHIIDLHALGRLPAGKYMDQEWQDASPALIAWQITSDNFEKVLRRRQREPLDDYSCEVQVIPAPSKILVLLYADDREFTKVFEQCAVPGRPDIQARDYAYYDNTDRPDGISQEDWEARGKEWDDALKGGIPALNGFGITCTTEYVNFLNRDEISESDFTPWSQRVRAEAKRMAIDNYAAKRYQQGQPIHEIVQLLDKASDWLKTQEGTRELAAITRAVRHRLPRKLLPLMFKSLKPYASPVSEADLGSGI